MFVTLLARKDVGGEAADAGHDAGVLAHPAGIFGHGAVAGVVKAVFDAPMAADGVGGAGGTRFVLAFAADQPVGFASFAVLYPGVALKGMLFLKDVFVVAEHRGQGVGERIKQYLAQFCAAQGIARIDWVVKTARSQLFYERLGATVQTRKRAMRLDGQALADLAEK